MERPGEAPTFLIVAVDGGGIRGLVPALLLQELVHSKTLDLDRVDLLAGTSTGSLIAAGLASGIGIDRIAGVYADECACREIFTPYGLPGADLARTGPCADGDDSGGARLRSGCLTWPFVLLARMVRGLHGGLGGFLSDLFWPAYSPRGFEKLVRGLAPDRTIGELERKVFLTSMCIDTAHDGHPAWRATAFHNMPAPNTQTEGFGGHANAPIVDAVLASSSAPVAFPPHCWNGKLFIDGGVLANSPSALALTAALDAGLVGSRGVPLDRVFLLSIGTGITYTRYPPPGAPFPPPFGALGWMWPAARGRGSEAPAVPLVSAHERASSEAADYQVRTLLGPRNYRRVQIDFGIDPVAMDDCAALVRIEAAVCAFRRSSTWEEAAKWVGEHFAPEDRAV